MKKENERLDNSEKNKSQMPTFEELAKRHAAYYFRLYELGLLKPEDRGQYELAKSRFNIKGNQD